MFFILDHDVAADVGRVIRHARHTCEMVGAAGLARADDDDVSVFADNHHATLLTHDQELITRRRRNTFGRHVHLDCREWEAATLVQAHLDELVTMVASRDAIVVKLSQTGLKPYRRRWL
jgi:uncharacterized protein with PIN domain